MGYSKAIIKGVSWTTGIRAVTRALSFGKTIIIARVLTPSQFGVFGIATLLLALIEILTETGVNIFLVQQKEDINKYINTAWIVSILRGLLIGCVIFATAPLVAHFFHTEQAREIISLISIIPILRGFINPAVVKLQKELLFGKQFYYQTILLFVETVVSILFVVITHSVNGLIYGMMISAVLEIILSFIIVKPTPRLIFHLPLFKNIIHHGKWITASTIFNYFYQHGDDIAVGRVLGASSLGLYDMAYKISLAPLTDFANVINQVTFPVFVKISEDRLRLRRAFLKSLAIVVLVVLPIGFSLSFFAKEIIVFVLGAKWIGAVPALQILGIFGAVRAISVFSSTVFLSIKRQDIFMLATLTGLIVLGITIIPFIYWWGISGAAMSALFGTIATLPVIFYFLFKYIL